MQIVLSSSRIGFNPRVNCQAAGVGEGATADKFISWIIIVSYIALAKRPLSGLVARVALWMSLLLSWNQAATNFGLVKVWLSQQQV